MSSSPRSRPSQTAIFALAVGAAIIGLSLLLVGLGLNVIEAGNAFVTGLYPPIAVTSEGAQIRDLYTIVFLIAVAIFILVEGLIIWTVIRYRRKPGDDTLPPQTHGNNVAEFVWTIVPTILVIFMFVDLVADAQPGRQELGRCPDEDPGGRRPVPVDSSTTSPRTARRSSTRSSSP